MQGHMEIPHMPEHAHTSNAFAVTKPQLAAVTVLTLLLLTGGILIAGRYGNFAMNAHLDEMGKMHKETMPDGMVHEQATAAKQFIDMMVPHHEGAVEMAKVAKQRSTRPEIQSLADDIISSQTEEIQQMRSLRQAWYGSDATPSLSEMPMLRGKVPNSAAHGEHEKIATPMTMDMAKEVESLRAAPEPFDFAFIDFMIRHHQSAIDAAKATLELSPPAEIGELSRAIISAQQREIEQMQRWKQEWFTE
ncbi:MAG: hypothetical protein RIR26_396 [Pseudomonadota bacterium]|jgi:uncharacterized protein (DUF305 family)